MKPLGMKGYVPILTPENGILCENIPHEMWTYNPEISGAPAGRFYLLSAPKLDTPPSTSGEFLSPNTTFYIVGKEVDEYGTIFVKLCDKKGWVMDANKNAGTESVVPQPSNVIYDPDYEEYNHDPDNMPIKTLKSPGGEPMDAQLKPD